MPKQTTPPTKQTTTRTPAPVRPAPVRANPTSAEVLVQRAMADPASLTAQDVVVLQRHLGNNAVQGLLSRPAASPAPAVQRAQAAAVAEVVSAEPELPEVAALESAGGGAPDSARPTPPPDDDPLQRQAAGGMGLAGGPVAADLEGRLQRARSGGQALPAPVRARMEGAFHTDFSSVKVHTDAEAHSLNQDLGARAFTTGNDVFFKDGEYQPAATDGQELLAHELTHVVQQGGGLRRKPNFIGAGPTKPGLVQRAGDDDVMTVAPPTVVAPPQVEGSPTAPTTEPVVDSNAPTEEDTSEVTLPELDDTDTDTNTDTDTETDTETETESESEPGQVSSTTGGGGNVASPNGSSAPSTLTTPTVKIPVYPPILSEREWDKNKGWKDKLGKDNIGTLLNILAAAHKGVVWDRFDIGRFPPAATPGARASVTASEAAQAALSAAESAKVSGPSAPPAAVRAATRALEAAKEALTAAQTAAKSAADEAAAGLKYARSEYTRNVMVLLGHLQIAYMALLQKQTKSPSDYLGRAVDALNAYKGPVAAVQNAFAAFEQARDHAQTLEAEAKQALAAIAKAEADAEDAESVDLDELSVTGEDNAPQGESLEGESESVEGESESVEGESESVEGETPEGVPGPSPQVSSSQVEGSPGPEPEGEDLDATPEGDPGPTTTTLTVPREPRPPTTMAPRTERTRNPIVNIPQYPTVLTDREWERNRSRAAKLGLGRDEIAPLVNIVAAAHKGVVWGRFDIGRFPPEATGSARAAEDTFEAAQTALGQGTGARAIAAAKEALTAAQAAAKSAGDEAESALGYARSEFKRNVIVLLGQLQMLYMALVQKQTKSPSDQVGLMVEAINAYKGQVAAVETAYQAYENARDYARTLEAQAKEALADLEKDDDDDEPSDAPLTTSGPGKEGGQRKLVQDVTGRKFFSDLNLIRFYQEPDVQQWIMSPDITVSARDSKTRNGALASLQSKGKLNLLTFKDAARTIKSLANQAMLPELAVKNIKTLWARAASAYDERTGFVSVHRLWVRNQINQGGSVSNYNAWKEKFTTVADLHERVGEYLLTDQDPIEAVSSQAAQLRG